MTRYFTFIGVTTRQSSIMSIFPRWRDRLALGDDVEIEGCDLPLHAPDNRYRDIVTILKTDSDHVGALVTTHKIDLYRAARDLFDDVDEFARVTDEVSCIARRGTTLLGWAKDPVCVGRCFQDMLGPGYFGHSEADVVCLGAGGAGVAICLYLSTRKDPGAMPRRLVITDRSPDRLRALGALQERMQSHIAIEYVLTSDPLEADALVASAPPCSLVINATGMGKDTPGSPVTDAVRFPDRGIIWELNYRGELPFLHQAWNQRREQHLRVEDGWQYFIYGWTSIIEEVFERPISASELVLLKDDAGFARPSLPTSTAGS